MYYCLENYLACLTHRIMFQFNIFRKQSRGLAPGSRIFVGDQKMDVPRTTVMDFNPEDIQEKEIVDVAGLGEYKTTNNFTWINVDGVHDPILIEKIGNVFDIDSLVQEDIMNTTHRPKMEEHEDYLFIVMPMVWMDEKTRKENSEQLSLIIGQNYLISFQEKTGDFFEPLRERIRKRKGSRVRTLGIDYLAYAIMDIVIDNYLHLIDLLGDQIEDLEDDVLDDVDNEIISKINGFKRDINYLRKRVRPVREFIILLSKSESDLLSHTTIPFMKDLHDHIQNAYENVETYREMLTDYLTLYHTGASTKLNDILRILTIFSAIFIPLTFIAGVYGTNFQYFPELQLRYAYPIFWAVLIMVTIGMFIFFKRKKWL